MIHLVTFATGNCVIGQTKLTESAIKYGIHEENIHSFSHDDLFNSSFATNNNHVFKEKKGIGYWSWKPYFILEVMKKIQYDDVIVYHDSGRPCYDWQFTQSIDDSVKHVCEHHQGVGIVFGPFNHGTWTKHDCLELMGCSEMKYKNHSQASATWGIWQKNVLSISILNEWMRWVTHTSRIVTDDASILSEESHKFKHNRHDQSILTNILLKLHFDGKYKNIMKSCGVYEKNFNKVMSKNIEKEKHI
jgi:hypothetical protein